MKKILTIILALFLYSLFEISVLACSCSKISSIKANMHTFQTLVETYAVDHGKYPKSAQDLKKEAVKGKYWKEFKNPFTNKNGYDKSYGDLSKLIINNNTQRLESPEYTFFLGLRVVDDKTIVDYPERGIVLYEYISNKEYRLYGTGLEGRLITDREDIFLTFPRKSGHLRIKDYT